VDPGLDFAENNIASNENAQGLSRWGEGLCLCGMEHTAGCDIFGCTLGKTCDINEREVDHAA